MGYFDLLADLGFMVVCRRNRLGTTTMFAVREYDVCPEYSSFLCRRSGEEVSSFGEVLDDLPEWRLVDFVGDDAAKGARLLYEKLTYTGQYAGHDERKSYGMGPEFLIGPEHRPESERFQAIPAAPPELVENLNLQDG